MMSVGTTNVIAVCLGLWLVSDGIKANTRRANTPGGNMSYQLPDHGGELTYQSFSWARGSCHTSTIYIHILYMYIYIYEYAHVHTFIYIWTRIYRDILVSTRAYTCSEWKATGWSEAEGSEAELVFLNSFFEQLCGESEREHGEVNQNAGKPS